MPARRVVTLGYMTVIGELLLGRGLDVALKGVHGGIRAFFANDSLGRLFVLLHADFGERTQLGRDVFYSWRTQEPLREALASVIAGRLRPDTSTAEQLAALIEPRLVRTPERDRGQLANEIALAAFDAAPFVAEGGSEATALLLNRLEPRLRELLEAIRAPSATSGEGANLAAALVLGPLRHIGAEQEAQEAEEAAEAGDHARAAHGLLAVADRLAAARVAYGADTLRERAATYFAAAGDLGRATELLQGVVEDRLEQGTALYRPALDVLRELLATEEQWIADALEARALWYEQPARALQQLKIAVERSEGRPDHLQWLASYAELAGMSGDGAAVLDTSAEVRRSPIETGPRLTIELEALEALEGEDARAAEDGWRELLRWADEQAQPQERAIVWQRRGLLLARREQVSASHDAYRRAMSSWSEVPGYEEQAGDAFYCLQAVSIANAKPIPDPELRPVAFALRGRGDTPVARAERDRQRGMESRLDEKLPGALAAFWRGYERSRRIGSLQGVLEFASRLAELYEHAGEPIPALQLYVAAGKGAEAKRVAARMDARQLAEAISDVGGARWERAAAYGALAVGGRLVPDDLAARYAPQLLADARAEADALVAPQPVLAAKRALAGLVFCFPEERREELSQQLLRDLWHPLIDIANEVATVLVPATDLGLVDAEAALVDRFLDDPYNMRISFGWIAERAAANPDLLERLRSAARGGDRGALEALAVGDLIRDDESLRARCSEEARRAAATKTIEEKQEDGRTSVSVGIGIRLEGPGTVARDAEPEARQLLLDRLMEIVTDGREPEGNRASAAGALFNLAPALTSEQAERVSEVLGPIALGHYELSQWDEDLDHPLSRFRISMHTANQLRVSAIGTLAQLTVKHPARGTEQLQDVVAAAFRDGPEPVIAAGIDAAARARQVVLPVPLEALLRERDPVIRLESLIAWATRCDGLPRLEALAMLAEDPDFQVRQQLMNMAARAGEDGRALLQQLAARDPDAYIRLRAARYLAGSGPCDSERSTVDT